MSTACISRLMADLKRMNDDPPEGISGAPREENIMLWDAVIFGPLETPWEGGIFKLTLLFKPDYPNIPPRVQFVSKMFHPNVYDNGRICLDILKNKWTPAYDVATVLTSIQSLLCDPNPDSPANPRAAYLYREDRREYRKKVYEVVQQSLLNI